VLIDMLESVSAALVEPDLVVSWVRKHTHIVSAMSIDMESASHSKFESFIKDVNIRETERSPSRIFTVYENKSLSSKDEMTLTSKVSSVSNMDMELNEVSSEKELLIHVSHRHEISVQGAVKSQSIAHSSCRIHHHRVRVDSNLLSDSHVSHLINRRLDDFSSLHIDVESGLTAEISHAHQLVLELGTSHLHHHVSSSSVLLSSEQKMLVDVLELEDTTLVEPELEVSWVRNHAHEGTALALNMETTHHTLLESFFMGFKVRKTEGAELRHNHISVNIDKSSSGEDHVTVSLELTETIDVDVEFDTVAAEHEFFVFSHGHELSINLNVVSHSVY